MRGPVHSPLLGSIPAWLPSLRCESLYGSRDSRFDRSWRVHEAPEDCCRLYWIRAGRGSLVHGGEVYALLPGHAYLVPSGRAMRTSVTQPLRLHWVHVRLGVWGGVDVAAFLALPGEVVPQVRQAYEKLWDAYLTVLYRADPAESLLLDGLLRQLLHPFIAMALRQQQAVPGRFSAMMEYARSHLAEALSLTDLARQAGMEATHFIRSFRRETGRTPMAWLRSCRVEAAIGDLASGGGTLGVVARRWGFCDAFHLSKAIKAATGRPPATLFRTEGHRKSVRDT